MSFQDLREATYAKANIQGENGASILRIKLLIPEINCSLRKSCSAGELKDGNDKEADDWKKQHRDRILLKAIVFKADSSSRQKNETLQRTWRESKNKAQHTMKE